MMIDKKSIFCGLLAVFFPSLYAMKIESYEHFELESVVGQSFKIKEITHDVTAYYVRYIAKAEDGNRLLATKFNQGAVYAVFEEQDCILPEEHSKRKGAIPYKHLHTVDKSVYYLLEDFYNKISQKGDLSTSEVEGRISARID